MRCLLYKRIERRSCNHWNIHSRQFSKLLLWIGNGRWDPIFGSQKLLVHHFKAISYIEAVTKIMKIAKTRIVNPRGVGTNKGLTRCGRGRGTRTMVGGFINAGDIHSLMGWGTRTITVVWQRTGTRIGSEIISAENIHSLIRQGW